MQIVITSKSVGIFGHESHYNSEVTNPRLYKYLRSGVTVHITDPSITNCLVIQSSFKFLCE